MKQVIEREAREEGVYSKSAKTGSFCLPRKTFIIIYRGNVFFLNLPRKLENFIFQSNLNRKQKTGSFFSVKMPLMGNFGHQLPRL